MPDATDPKTAEAAYAAAEAYIAAARDSGADTLNLAQDDCTALTHLPDSLNSLPNLKILTLGDYTAHVAVTDLTPLANLARLTTLSLSNTQITDLTPLANLTGLTTLYLSNTQITDLTPLGNLSGLTTLNLNNTQVTDISPLANLTELTTLTLDKTQVTDIFPLAALHGLTLLTFDNTQVTDLAPLPGLKTLNFDNTPVTELSPIATSSELTALSLCNTQVTDLSPLAKLSGLRWLMANDTQVTDLSPLASHPELRLLRLNNTAITDLSPLANISGLTTFSLYNTQITDISPLVSHTGLKWLGLDDTLVTDLRPIRRLKKLVDSPVGSGLTFENTTATRIAPRIAEIAKTNGSKARAAQLFAYLQDWVPPDAATPPARDQTEPDSKTPPNFEPLTVTTLIEAQDLAGWRFSPHFGALELFVSESPEEERQRQLAEMVAARLADLIQKLNRSSNNLGLRHDALTEADRFAAVLADNDRPLSIRSLEFWGHLVALGGLLDGNDAALSQGRDPLDCLTAESRAAMQTLLAVGAGFVRSFPDARELDDAHGGFNRNSLPPDLLLRLVQKAVDKGLIAEPSAQLIELVAKVAKGEGTQADKAHSVSARGSKNLAISAAMIAMAGGVVGGVTGPVGGVVFDHYEIGTKAEKFLDAIDKELSILIDGLLPDEKANLRSILQDLKAMRPKGSRRSTD